MQTKLIQTKDYLLLINEEAEIKENDYLLLNNEHPNGRIRKCFHLTNNNALWNGKDWNTLKGKHFFIDPKESEGWGFVTEFECKKIIAYYPLSKEAKELEGLPLLPNPFKEDEFQKSYQIVFDYVNSGIRNFEAIMELIELKKIAQSKQFSLEDMQKAIEMARLMTDDGVGDVFDTESISGLTELCTYGLRDKYSEEEIIQSLSTQQLPKEFIPEYKKVHRKNSDGEDIGFPVHDSDELKTIINSEGKQELIGIYKY